MTAEPLPDPWREAARRLRLVPPLPDVDDDPAPAAAVVVDEPVDELDGGGPVGPPPPPPAPIDEVVRTAAGRSGWLASNEGGTLLLFAPVIGGLIGWGIARVAPGTDPLALTLALFGALALLGLVIAIRGR